MESKIKAIVTVKTIKGTSFVGVRNYQNSQGEISNQTFLVGIDYAKLMQGDLDKIKKFDTTELKKLHPAILVDKAVEELTVSLEKRLSDEITKENLRNEGDSTIARSDAQIDAYTPICKGLKAKDNELYIFGLAVKKTVLVAIEYKQVNSRELTVIKEKIKKLADFRETKYRMFKLGNLEELQLQGITIK